MPASLNPLFLVASIEPSLAFYRQLGFRTTFSLRESGRLYFCELAFEAHDTPVLMLLDRAHWRFPEDLDRACGTGTILYVPVDDVAARRAGLPSDIVPYDDLAELYYGCEFVVRDPDGYRLAFFEPHPKGERLPAGTEAGRG